MNSTILILGCGDVGGALGKRLLDAGHRVIGARRNVAMLPAGIEPLALDVGANEPLESLPDADILVYAISADRFEESAYRSAYRDGLDAVLKVFENREHKPKRVLFVSSTSVYAQQQGETVDERSPTEPNGFSGQLMVEAERRLIESPLPGSVVRFSGIYGPGRERLIQQVLEGRVAPSAPVMYSNRIHRDDCVGVLDWLIARALGGQPLDDVYLGSDCEPTPISEVMGWLAKRLKVEPSSVIQSPLRRRASKRCSNARLVELGYRFTYPSFRDGYEQVIKEAGLGATVR